MADFKLGRIKFKWRGDWAVSTAYLIDDIVKYGGNTYVVTANHTSQSSVANFYTDLSASKYSLHSEGLFFKGNWAGSTFYRLNDLVKNGAFQYRCKLQHTSASTFAIGSNWEVFAEGLQWEDSYNSSTTYQDGDVVTYGGYTYVYINATPASGQTPTDNSYWDVVTTGFKALGTYSHGTAYKTGDTVQYGGNNYVATANHSNQYPSNQNGTVNSSYWTLNLEGFNYRAAYDATATYNIGDVVRLAATSYVAITDRINNVSPDSDTSKWQVVAQGDSAAVLSTRGDLIKQGGAATERLAIGPVGSVLTTDGTDPSWSAPEGANVKYVSNSGSDSNPGSQYLPYKTIYYALSQATSGDVVAIDTIAGGTGGTPGVFDVTQNSTTGSGTGFKARVTTDGSSTPTIIITDGGSGHAVGDDITIDGSQLGSSSNLTFNVTSASIGDVVYIKNGVYREILPIKIPAGVTVQGESLRGTEIRPASGTGHQIKTIGSITGGTGGTPGTYNFVHQNSTTGSGTGVVVNVTTDGSSTPSVTIYNGGSGYVSSEQITINGATKLGGASNLVFTVTALENNDASNMFIMNNSTNLVQMSMKGLTGTPGAGGTSKAAVVSLDPSGSITTASPYVQNCSSVNAGATGIQIDGNLHSAGNKSILANDYTQINSDGRGVHALGGGRGEMVSIFTYYCDKSFFAESGGFIRGLNCSSAYGEKGAEATGTLASETAVSVQTRGQMLKYNTTEFVGAATESDVSDMIATQGVGTATVSGAGGASATVFRTNISTDHFHIENITGSFVDGEVLTITKEDSSTFQVKAAASSAQTGQTGALIAVDSSDSTLGSSGVIKLGANVQFAGDSTYYRVSAVSEENTSNRQALIRLTQSVTSGNAIADNTATTITTGYSNIRLTGHDFLSIGTGDFTSTNYPGSESQAPDQSDEVNELLGGRVYFTSTDQNGDFRVGDLFRIEQATGVATLNADAFDLSGLNELQLGSIGAELGATINEFSTDETLGGDANTAVPTERAIVGYTQRDKMGTGHLVPPTGTTSQRPTGASLFTGGIRYNSTLVTWEGYNGTQWTGLGGGNPWATHTADGSTALTVAANDRYFIDTTSGAQTANLPASPQVGDQVSFVDLAGTFDTNNLTIGRNSLKIMGLAEDLVVSTEDAGIQLVYTGSTYGWKLTNNI
tara:strand:+ start:2873 stop:6391 length:3519 start_codon:yes stop_codon:yes gene_type:complete